MKFQELNESLIALAIIKMILMLIKKMKADKIVTSFYEGNFKKDIDDLVKDARSANRDLAKAAPKFRKLETDLQNLNDRLDRTAFILERALQLTPKERESAIARVRKYQAELNGKIKSRMNTLAGALA